MREVVSALRGSPLPLRTLLSLSLPRAFPPFVYRPLAGSHLCYHPHEHFLNFATEAKASAIRCPIFIKYDEAARHAPNRQRNSLKRTPHSHATHAGTAAS